MTLYLRLLQARELAKVVRRMHAADKRYWEESEFLLLRNEIALQTLFQDNTTTQRTFEHFEIEVTYVRKSQPIFQEL